MADLIPADEAGTAELVREAQLAHVLDLLVNHGLSQKEACDQVGISLRTFQREIGSSRAVAEVRRQTDGVLAAGVIAAYDGYLAGIERLKGIIDSPLTAPRDVIAAVKALHQVLREFGGALVISTGATVDDQTEAESRRVQVAFDPELLMRGPVTMRMSQAEGHAVLEGAFSNLDEPEDLGPVVVGQGPVAGGQQVGAQE